MEKQERLNNALESLKKLLSDMTEEQKQEMIDFFRDDRPKGWLDIDEYLPMMFAEDIEQGYSVFKVKDKDGNVFESRVTDHNIWFYFAKEQGITHWFNE